MQRQEKDRRCVMFCREPTKSEPVCVQPDTTVQAAAQRMGEEEEELPETFPTGV
jgi:hypothetical protein